MKVTIASFINPIPTPLRATGSVTTLSNQKHPQTTMTLSEDGSHISIEGFRRHQGVIRVPMWGVAWYQLAEGEEPKKRTRVSRRKTTPSVSVPESAVRDEPPGYSIPSVTEPDGDDAA